MTTRTPARGIDAPTFLAERNPFDRTLLSRPANLNALLRKSPEA
jgi:hypothetical protein